MILVSRTMFSGSGNHLSHLFDMKSMRIAHCSDVDVPLYVSAHQIEDDCPRRVWPHEIA